MPRTTHSKPSNALVVACSKGGKFAEALARKLAAHHSALLVETFPDGETKIRFAKPVKGKTVVLVQSLHPSPNDALMELLFALTTARDLGARKTIAVVPYLAYARQDSRFRPGEVVSNKIVARMIEEAGAGAFLTVTTHLHRIRSLSQLFREIPARDILLCGEIASYARKLAPKLNSKSVVVVGPDFESTPIVKRIAKLLGTEYYVFLKKRLSGTTVKNIQAPGLDCKGKRVLLVDDMASTGNTLISVTGILKRKGAKRVDCVVVHLLDEEGGLKILKNGIDSLACSNTLYNKYAKIDAAKPSALELEKLL